MHLKMLELHQAMFLEANPVPVKTALSLTGKIGSHVRLPLCPMQPATLEKLKDVLKKNNVI